MVWGISFTSTHAATFVINLRDSSQLKLLSEIKVVRDDGEVDIIIFSSPADIKSLRAMLGLSHGYRFFYNTKELFENLSIWECTGFSPWESLGTKFIAMPSQHVGFMMKYLPIEKNYQGLNLFRCYAYASVEQVSLTVEGYIHEENKGSNNQFPLEIKRLIALFISLRCKLFYTPCIKAAIKDPIRKNIVVSSAYKEHIESLLFDLTSLFFEDDIPCDLLKLLPKTAILNLYMYKDHFLHVKFLRWLTYTQQCPLDAYKASHIDQHLYELKKSCINSLLTTGDISVPLLKKIVQKAHDIFAYDVLVGLAYHGFLKRSYFSNVMKYDLIWSTEVKEVNREKRFFLEYYYAHLASDKVFESMMDVLSRKISLAVYYTLYKSYTLSLRERMFRYFGLRKAIKMRLCPDYLSTRQELLLPAKTIMQAALKEGNFRYADTLLQGSFLQSHKVDIDLKRIIQGCNNVTSFPPALGSFLKKILSAQPHYVSKLYGLLEILPIEKGVLSSFEIFLSENFSSHNIS